MTRIMGEPFPATGSPPEGYKPGDYVEILNCGWRKLPFEPRWDLDAEYRLEATHPHYLPPVWCLDRAAQLAGCGSWECVRHAGKHEKAPIIAHARTLRDGCQPMQEPVDPLVEAINYIQAFSGTVTPAKVVEYLRARFDITEKAK